ncbi:MAG TPA: acyl-CoA thioesterase [Beijerinckiaceae bacterium]|jgi:acyl-CoA thioesterase FadM|nr:acyl-CoA thioesterase [Beijerinckiaceae bacterium]
MLKPIEQDAPPRPFVHAIAPYWADADPAGIVYTARFTDYALRAIDAWMIDRIGAGFYVMNTTWGIGTPFVHTECDLRAPARPGENLNISVSVERVGKTSITFAVQGHGAQRGLLHFEGRFICVCVSSLEEDVEVQPIALDIRIRSAAEAELRAI